MAGEKNLLIVVREVVTWLGEAVLKQAHLFVLEAGLGQGACARLLGGSSPGYCPQGAEASAGEGVTPFYPCLILWGALGLGSMPSAQVNLRRFQRVPSMTIK